MSDTATFPALGFNPAPGTAQAVTALADDLRKVATDIGHAHEQLANIGKDNGIWAGDAAHAFQQRVGPLPDYLDKANQSLGDAGRVLGQWANDLSALQTRAQHFEAEAQKAKEELQRAESNPDLKLAGQNFPDQEALQRAQSKLDAATQACDRAKEELDAIREQAKRLQQQHHDLVDDVVKALNKAKDEAIPPPGLLERIGEALSSLGKSIADTASKAWDFIKKHADDIKAVGDVLSTVSSVLGAIAIVTAPLEPVGAVFAAASAVTGAGALAAHGLAKAAGANVSWGSLGGDALALIPFGKGFVAGSKVATLAKDATPFAKGLGKGAAEEASHTLNKGFGSSLQVAEKEGKQLFSGFKIKEDKTIGAIGENATYVMLKGKGFANRMAMGANEAVNNLREGQWLGTKGLSKVGINIDPMSGVGRTLDSGIKAGHSVGSYVYNQIEASQHSPSHPSSASAGQIMHDRVAARGAA